MKKTFCIFVLVVVLVFAFSSCVAVVDKEIKGDIVTDIDKIDTVDKTEDDVQIQEDLTEEKEQEPKRNVEAHRLNQSLGASDNNDEDENGGLALAFVQALVKKDTDALASLVMANEGGVDFIKYMNVSEFVIVPFEFPQELIDEKTKDGNCYYEQDSLNYAVTLKIEGIPEDVYTPFENGESLWYMKVTPYPFTGNNVLAFVKAEEAEENIFPPIPEDNVHCIIDEISVSDVFEKLEEGKNDACNFDFKPNTCIHPVTHMMAYMRGDYPPYSLNEINDFLAKVFDNNAGIDASCIPMWSTSHQMSQNIDLSDPAIYSDFDRKMLGCGYFHGGASLQFDIAEDEKNGTERTVTVKYYSDFAHFGVSKICVYHFDESGEYPCLLGIELLYDSGVQPALFSI